MIDRAEFDRLPAAGRYAEQSAARGDLEHDRSENATRVPSGETASSGIVEPDSWLVPAGRLIRNLVADRGPNGVARERVQTATPAAIATSAADAHAKDSRRERPRTEPAIPAVDDWRLGISWRLRDCSRTHCSSSSRSAAHCDRRSRVFARHLCTIR